MAKKTNAKRGGGDIQQQIDRLQAMMTKKEIAEADQLVRDYDVKIIRLAFKKVPKQANSSRISKRDQARIDLLAKTDPKEAETLRNLMLKASV